MELHLDKIIQELEFIFYRHLGNKSLKHSAKFRLFIPKDKVVNLFMDIEEKFGVEFNRKPLSDWKTFDDIVTTIKEQKGIKD